MFASFNRSAATSGATPATGAALRSGLLAATALATGLLVGSSVELKLPKFVTESVIEQGDPELLVQNAPDGAEANDNLLGLLNYIQRFESAGAINSQGVKSAYDVVYGGIAAADRPPVPLTSMTVSQVLEWQDSIDARYPSEAAGAYQVMEDTLRELVTSGQLDPDLLFDEATQDAVAEMLMERRGLSKFLAGTLSAEDFADSLAKEWASFPVLRDQNGANRRIKRGQSYYAGDGLNKAHADPDEFLAVIKGIQSRVAKTPAKEASSQVEYEDQAQQAAGKDNEDSSLTITAAKSFDGPVQIEGELELQSHYNWQVGMNASYEFGTDAFSVGGKATYEKDSLSISVSGAHDGDDAELRGTLTYNF